MPELPSNILTSLTNLPHAPELARAYLQPVDLAPDETPPWNSGGSEAGNAIAFQYWPETIQDSRASEWRPKPIPGGSHPLYQWTNGGERRLTFTAIFTTDTAPEDTFLADPNEGNLPAGSILRAGDLDGSGDPYSLQQANPLSGLEVRTRDIDLRAVVSWLRWYTYPYYDPQNNWRAYEPPKALLVMPNMGLGYSGYDSLLTVMTQCDVTYEACFDSGFPRIIEVSLEFAEVVQSGERVQFHGRRQMGQGGYVRNIDNYLAIRGNER